MKRVKSKKTYSLAIEIKGKLYFVSRIEDIIKSGYSGNYYDRERWEILRLTEKTSSAKKWKTYKGIIDTLNYLVRHERCEVRFKRQLMFNNNIYKWNGLIDDMIKFIENEKKDIKNEIMSERFIDHNAKMLINIINKIKSIKRSQKKSTIKGFYIVDSSHNFRKLKLENLNDTIQDR